MPTIFGGCASQVCEKFHLENVKYFTDSFGYSTGDRRSSRSSAQFAPYPDCRYSAGGKIRIPPTLRPKYFPKCCLSPVSKWLA
jgi:hypothetical protein